MRFPIFSAFAAFSAFSAFSAAASFLLLACNGGGTGSDGGAAFTAKIDGQAWTSTEIGTTVLFVAGVPGTLVLQGTNGAASKSRSITITVYNVRGPGKYPLGVGSDVVGGTGQTAESTDSGGNANSWITPGTGDDGMVEIAALGGGRVKGTFFFTADTGRRNPTGVKRAVTEGRFDLALAGTLPVLPAKKGSMLTAKLGGVHYYAASIVAFPKDHLAGPGVNISTTTSLHGLSLLLQNVTDTGTYTLSNTQPIRTLTAGRNTGTGNQCCWQTQDGDTGEIRITSLDSNRVKGSFKGVIKPTAGRPATTPLEIVEGTFDVGFGI